MNTRQTIRQQIRQSRNNLTPIEQQQAAKQLLPHISDFDAFEQANNIGLYLANDGELSPLEVIKLCWQMNKNVYLPVLHPFAKGHLLFLHYQQHDELQLNRFSIPEPVLEKERICPVKRLDLVFTPLVAFDTQGQRLGMGGGFYDRTFSFTQNEKTHSPLLVGLAHDCQQVEKLPTEAWDVPLQHIITPTKHHQFNPNI